MADAVERLATPPGVATVLIHPTGTEVYLVGVAHVSLEAVKDVTDAITAVMPGVVVLELDKERFKRIVEEADFDPYGVKRRAVHGLIQPLGIVLRGQILEYGLATAYTIAGALLGVPAGQEFRAAVVAAQQVGAEVVLGDRPQDVTMKRLSRLAIAQASLERDSTGGNSAKEVWGKVGSKPTSDGETLQSSDDKDAVVKRVGERWRTFLEEAGCQDPDGVLQAFKRIVRSGMSKKADIEPSDVLSVRDCGQKLIEMVRQKAVKEGDDALEQLENEALQEVGAGAGVLGLPSAMEQVLGTERDLILAHQLWKAGARGDSVVGVVGAAHIKGIKNNWAFAGTPEAEQQVQSVMRAPKPDATSSFASVALTGGCIGLLAYTRPRLAAKVAAAGVILTAPWLGLTAVTVNRWSSFAERLVEVSQQVDKWKQEGDIAADFQPAAMQSDTVL